MPTNINSELLDQTRRNIDTAKVLAFFKKYPISAATDSISSTSQADEIIKKIDPDSLINATSPFHQLYDGNRKVTRDITYQRFEAQLHFFDVVRKEDGQVMFNRGVASLPGAVHAYYLPWESEALTSVKLPAGRSPQLFITSALSGCSVFARGNPASPIVQHAGTLNRYRGNAPLFWRQCANLAAGRDGITDLSAMGAINKFDYLNTDNLTVRRFKNWMEAQHHQKELKVENVYKTGFVFGIRTNGNWEFYLQERVMCETTAFYKERKTIRGKALGFIPTRKRVTVRSRKKQTIHRPVSVRKFFPAGSFHMNLLDFSRIAS